ncbi:MAG TPA: hypothetical protein VKG80_14595 [Trebonia sp.]|nr:hypothetical protein [Trebonia sp.]
MPPRGRVPDVRKAHEDLLERGAPPVGVRGMVADSWLRPAAAGVDAEAGQPPITLVADQLGEYMVILAACPAGLTADELAYLLYPAGVMSSTPRAELIRLRALLGDHVLASRPYRLTCEVASDWAAVSAQLAAGNLGEALRLYHGPLLPRSEAPGVAELRDDLERALRSGILASGQPDHIVSWTRSGWGAGDLEMGERLCVVLPASSPLLPFAMATAAKLDAELAC